MSQELERVYTINLGKVLLSVDTHRAPRAINMIKEFARHHMKTSEIKIEDSLRDSLKMLYENAPPHSVKHSMLYVVGGNNIPAGVLNSISNLTNGILGESSSHIDMSSSSSESKIVMLSSIQGMTKFEKYDPLGMIPQEDTLDWTHPDCSIDYKLDLYQLE